MTPPRGHEAKAVGEPHKAPVGIPPLAGKASHPSLACGIHAVILPLKITFRS